MAISSRIAYTTAAYHVVPGTLLQHCMTYTNATCRRHGPIVSSLDIYNQQLFTAAVDADLHTLHRYCIYMRK